MKRTITLLFVALILPASGYATTLLDFGDELRAMQADAIVEGIVTDIRTEQKPNRGGVNSYITLSVSSVIKGKIGNRTQVVIQEKGGRTPQQTQVIFGTPEYLVGESVLVYLKKARSGSLG